MNDPGSRREVDRALEGVSRNYGDALRAADGAAAERIALGCLREGMTIETLYARVIAPAMWRIGKLWEHGAITIADEHLATALTHRVMASAYGSSFGHVTSRPGRILLAVVEGQRHALGLRMAADVLELGGYEVNYLGEDVPVDELMAAIRSRDPDLVGLSGTLTAGNSSLATSVAAVEDTFPTCRSCLAARAFPAAPWRDAGRSRPRGSKGSSVWSEGVLKEVEDVSTLSSSRPADPLFHSGADSPEGLMLEAAADASDLARAHARMAHSYGVWHITTRSPRGRTGAPSTTA